MHKKTKAGFTLLELVVVIFIISLVAAVVYPQIMPLIMWGELEGTARHLTGYGRAVIDHATLMKQEVTVRFDLDKQEYYTVQWIYPEEEDLLGEDPEPDQIAKLMEMKSSGMDKTEMVTALAKERDAKGSSGGILGEFDDEMANNQYKKKFDGFARQLLEARAKNVKHDESMIDEMGPLFDKEFDLEEKFNEPEEVEIEDPILQRSRIEHGLRLEEVVIESKAVKKGVAEIMVTPLGLQDRVLFYIVNEEEEYYTVFWDPIAGDALFESGRLDFDDFGI